MFKRCRDRVRARQARMNINLGLGPILFSYKLYIFCFMCMTMFLNPDKETGWDLLKVPRSLKQQGGVSRREGERNLFSSFSLKNFSEMSLDASMLWEIQGLRTEFIALDRVLALWGCLLIISQEYLALDFWAAVWKLARQFFKIFQMKLRGDLFFHLSSAFWQACPKRTGWLIQTLLGFKFGMSIFERGSTVLSQFTLSCL